jgi:branched-subunit amino acid transport protein
MEKGAFMGRSKAAAYGVLIVAGSLTSFVAESFVCRWLAPKSVSLGPVLLTALAYVFAAVLSGLAGTCVFWTRSRMDPSLSLSLFVLTSAVGWVWVPSVLLLSRQDSIGAVLAGTMGAAVMATDLRKVVISHTGAPRHSSLGRRSEGRELFAQSLYAPPRERHALLISVCIYGGCFALHLHEIFAASILLALCTFLLAWKLTFESDRTSENTESKSRAGLRLVRVGLAAVLFTFAVVLLGLQRRIHSSATDIAFARGRGSSVSRAPEQKKRADNSLSGLAGYESIILWPAPEKKKILAPSPSRTSLQGVRMSTKPRVIPFQGAYWYFRPRGKGPGSRTHVAHGNPLTLDIRSSDFVPLVMEAHQDLGVAIELACCREIQVAIENNDNTRGAIALGVLLTDSTSFGKPTLYLDQQPVVSAEPSHFSFKSSPALEVLRFAIPNHPRIQTFDEITVIVFPDSERARTGAKIAITQFALVPH